MRIKTLLSNFETHCKASRSKLVKAQMLGGLKEGLCPFRCRYCRDRKKDCQNCIILELKETKEFKDCQQSIKDNPDLLKMLIPILQKVRWKESNLRGGF